jgi:hypothetical protein
LIGVLAAVQVRWSPNTPVNATHVSGGISFRRVYPQPEQAFPRDRFEILGWTHWQVKQRARFIVAKPNGSM